MVDVKLLITIKDTEETLTMEEADKLYRDLEKIFGKKHHVPPPTHPYPRINPFDSTRTYLMQPVCGITLTREI